MAQSCVLDCYANSGSPKDSNLKVIGLMGLVVVVESENASKQATTRLFETWFIE